MSSDKLHAVLHEPSPTHKTARKMLLHRKGPISYVDDRKPYCDDPQIVAQYEKGKSNMSPGAYIERHVPCRKCEKCLTFRRLQWRDRMKAEMLGVHRTWMVTLTFSPTHLAGVIAEAAANKYENHIQAVEAAAYKHVQGYLKRCRKTGGRFRFVAMAEYGSKEGRLHYHLLIHEAQLGQITYRLLNDKWRSFVGAELVRNAGGSAAYVSKYLTKDLSRPRASSRYGKAEPLPEVSSDRPSSTDSFRNENQDGLTSSPERVGRDKPRDE